MRVGSRGVEWNLLCTQSRRSRRPRPQHTLHVVLLKLQSWDNESVRENKFRFDIKWPTQRGWQEAKTDRALHHSLICLLCTGLPNENVISYLLANEKNDNQQVNTVVTLDLLFPFLPRSTQTFRWVYRSVYPQPLCNLSDLCPNAAWYRKMPSKPPINNNH